MDNALSMTMIYSLEELLHVASCLFFAKCLVCLLRDFIEQLASSDVLHNEVNVFCIVICLEILDNVGMVQSVQNSNFFHDAINVFRKFMLIKNFYSDLEVLFKFVCRHEHSSECSDSENFSLIVDNVVLLEFMHSLLLSSFVD